MIHVMNFKGEIVDFISQSDSAVIQAVHKRDINERMETFDFTILSERTTHMQERNRIIIQDKNEQYREFIIDRISSDIDGYTEVETVASYLEDITKARPYAPEKLEKMTTKQALSDVLKDTGWEVSDATEYGGLRTTSWTSYQTRYNVLLQLCTTYDMMADFYIEVGSNRVDKRLVVLRKRNPLFKGKEIEYGKDLTGLKRTVDFSEIKTALLCVGPEPEEGKKRVELVVKDDESQAKYGLPDRYNWGVYEPETEDQNMTESRLRTLGTTELNKRKSEVITYEVTAIDIEKEYKHEVINLGDMVRIKNRDFTPPLYVEAEVISEECDLISKDVTYGFGTYKEFKESDLRSSFDRKLDAIRQKLTDGFSNVNTIVRESLEGELQYFERKILKGDTPPDNPVNDLLWLDTSNPDVAVLRRYWEGQWINATAEKAEDIGAITREKALYSELTNTFVNLSIQHSKLLNEMHDVMNSEYLVDFDLKDELNAKLDATVSIYNNIKSNLESMTDETATIGKLIDTQTLFLNYRVAMQNLYNVVERAKVAIDERFKLLQSQYTEEKFRDALQEIADKFGLQVNEQNQLIGEPNVVEKAVIAAREDTKEQLRDYVKSVDYQTNQQGLIERMESADAERKTLAGQISDKVTKSEYQSGLDNIKIGNRNLLLDSSRRNDIMGTPKYKYIKYKLSKPLEVGKEYTLSFDYKIIEGNNENRTSIMGLTPNTSRISIDLNDGGTTYTFKADNESTSFLIYTGLAGTDSNDTTKIQIDEAMLVEGNIAGNYTEAPEDVERSTDKKLSVAKTEILQDGEQISQRVSKDVFNTSSQTLNRVVSEFINNTTDGMTFRFDENGNIQSHSIGPQGIKFDATKFEINDGDVVVKNGRTTIKDAYIDKLFSNQATIEYLKATDIDLNRATVSGTSNGESTVLSGGKIRSTGSFTRTFPQGNVTYEAFTESWNGVYRAGLISKQFGNRKLTDIERWLALTDKGITTQREIHSLSPDKNGARFIDFFADESYSSNVFGQGMHIYSGQQLTIESEYGLYLNANKRFYIRTVDSGLEINKNGQNLVLKRTTPYTSDVGSGGSYMAIQSSDGVEQGHVGILSNNRNLSLSSSFGEILLKGSKVFALDSNGSNRVPMYAQYFSGDKVIGNIEAADTNIYAMCHSEFRVVSKAGYNGGDITYKNIRFNSWNAMSHEKYKYDIQKWDYNVLDLFRNDLQLYAYKVNSEAGTDYARIHHGIVLRENSNLDKFPVEWRNSDGFDGNEVLWWNTKAIQELANENEELKKQIDELKEKIDVILEMVK
ncbi:phage tail spike protein [Staphylococcus chromogenes]|uniref:phage tail spike protein n=1 Tax=Staphylococcus chromogenes TaxID=46126 RepID=UPI001F547DE4|nr:phage tail spike protein [Staphylococcus chromogenes]